MMWMYTNCIEPANRVIASAMRFSVFWAAGRAGAGRRVPPGGLQPREPGGLAGDCGRAATMPRAPASRRRRDPKPSGWPNSYRLFETKMEPTKRVTPLDPTWRWVRSQRLDQALAGAVGLP